MKLKYILYCIVWKFTHFGKLYKGMEPACYNEWLFNEYMTELLGKSDDYLSD